MRIDWTKYSLVDTNVLIYALDPSDELKHEIANEIFEALMSGEEKIAVSTQTLSEALNVFRLAKMMRSGTNFEDVCSIITDIVNLEMVPKLIVTPQTVLEAGRLCSAFNVMFYDALIAATMKENGITRIYTEDRVE